jgi:hypothetical protein
MKYFREAFENPETVEQQAERLRAEEEQRLRRMAINAEAKQAENATEEKQKKPGNYLVGELVYGNGVYVKRSWVRDEETGIVEPYDFFAAPEDLKNEKGSALWTYPEAVKELSHRKNWYGHHGGDFESFQDVALAASERRYEGEWFIPEIQVLSELYTLREYSSFAGSFNLTPTKKSLVATKYPETYWSSTKVGPKACSMNFCSGEIEWQPVRVFRLSCRPCWMEKVEP